MNNNPFSPSQTKSIPATTSSSSNSFTIEGQSLRIYNSGLVDVFIRYGTGTQTAVTTDMPIPPGDVEVFSVPNNALTTFAAITASGTATIYGTIGNGN